MSGIQTSGKQNPEQLATQKRAQAEKALRGKHKSKRVSQLNAAAQAELLEAIAIRLDIADENGLVRACGE
jgi:hypothetical protein